MDWTNHDPTGDTTTPPPPSSPPTFETLFLTHQPKLQCTYCRRTGTIAINNSGRRTKYRCTQCSVQTTEKLITEQITKKLHEKQQKQLTKQKQQKQQPTPPAVTTVQQQQQQQQQQPQQQHQQQQHQHHHSNDNPAPPTSTMPMDTIHQALESFEHHPALPDFMKHILTQLTSMSQTIVQLQQQLRERDQTISDLQKSVDRLTNNSLPSGSAPTPDQPTPALQQDTNNPWNNSTQLRQLRTSLPSPPTSRTYKRTQAAARTFFPVSPTRGFTYLYLNTNKRLPIKELRAKFRKLGILSNRLLDIHYPTRNVIATLIHTDYQKEFTEQLHTFGITPISDFDPLDPAHLHNPEYTADDIDITEKAQHASRIMNERMIRTLRFIRPSLRFAVSLYFLNEGWIDDTERNMILDDQDAPMDSQADFLQSSNSTTSSTQL